jgi:hypothetical protein
MTDIIVIRCMTCKTDLISPETLTDHFIGGVGSVDYSDVRIHKIRVLRVEIKP